MARRRKFRIGDTVHVRPPGTRVIRASGSGFLVLGEQGRADGTGERFYLLENIENPYHPTLWMPEEWLQKVKTQCVH